MKTVVYSFRDGFWRIALIVFLVVTCLRVWVGPAAFVDTALAQIPDAGTQRKRLVDELGRTNLILLDIKQILKERTINVRVEGADNAGTDNRARSGRR